MANYADRFVLNLDRDDPVLNHALAGIVLARSGIAVHGGRCLRDSDSLSLVTIIGHGNGSTISARKDGQAYNWTPLALARYLTGDCALAEAAMITLVSCGGALNPDDGFAGALHSALKMCGVKTKLNARRGDTIVVRGQQYVQTSPAERSYYREKTGTKILFYWNERGEQRYTDMYEGYEGNYKVIVEPPRHSEMPPADAGSSSPSSPAEPETPQTRYEFGGARPKKKD